MLSVGLVNIAVYHSLLNSFLVAVAFEPLRTGAIFLLVGVQRLVLLPAMWVQKVQHHRVPIKGPVLGYEPIEEYIMGDALHCDVSLPFVVGIDPHDSLKKGTFCNVHFYLFLVCLKSDFSLLPRDNIIDALFVLFDFFRWNVDLVAVDCDLDRCLGSLSV